MFVKVALDGLLVTQPAGNTPAFEYVSITDYLKQAAGAPGYLYIPIQSANDALDAWRTNTKGLPLHIKRKLFNNFKTTCERMKPGEFSKFYALKLVGYAIKDLEKSTQNIKRFVNPAVFNLLDGKRIKDTADHIANTFLADSADRFTKDDTGQDLLSDSQIIESSQTAAAEFQEIGLVPPFPEFELTCKQGDRNPRYYIIKKTNRTRLEYIAIRLGDAEFIERNLEKQVVRVREYIELLMGNVNAHKANYCSYNAVKNYIASQKQQEQWKSEMIVQDVDNPELQITLKDAADASTANRVNRRNELMTRIRGFEDVATRANMAACMVTLTCPSKYHSSSKKYDGATPPQAQKYLTSLWDRARSKLNRDKIEYFGLRVAEPHADACPHWHMIVFCAPAQFTDLKAALYHHATFEEPEEIEHLSFEDANNQDKSQPGHPRIDFLDIDPSKGTASGYIAKYVAKNIDASYTGELVDNNTKTGKDSDRTVKENLNAVLAWASLWRIRQFQFLGSPSVGLWRELRRFMHDYAIKEEDFKNGDFERVGLCPCDFVDLCNFADAGDWGGFVDTLAKIHKAITKSEYKRYRAKGYAPKSALKQAKESAKINRPNLAKQENENKYGETAKKTIGIIVAGFEFVTRSTKWAIRTVAQAAQALSSWSDSVASWSADNNWTGTPEQVWEQVQKHGSRLSQINKLNQPPPEWAT